MIELVDGVGPWDAPSLFDGRDLCLAERPQQLIGRVLTLLRNGLLTTVTLIVGELTANAVTHGRVPGRDFRPRLSTDPAAGLVRVEVTDTRDDRMPSGPPVPALPGPDAEAGRGLCLVAVLASRWAVVPRTDGVCGGRRPGLRRLTV